MCDLFLWTKHWNNHFHEVVDSTPPCLSQEIKVIKLLVKLLLTPSVERVIKKITCLELLNMNIVCDWYIPCSRDVHNKYSCIDLLFFGHYIFFSKFSIGFIHLFDIFENSYAKASEFHENTESMFPLHYMHSYITCTTCIVILHALHA